MAEYLTVDDISVVVVAEGQPLVEYVDYSEMQSHSDVPIIYVEANEPCLFSIDCDIPTDTLYGCHGVLIELCLDGTSYVYTFNSRSCMGSWIRKRLDGKDYIEDEHCIRGWFKFTPLELTEVGAHYDEGSVERYQALGQITVNIYRAQSRRSGIEQPEGPKTMMAEAPVHERALMGRAITHGITMEEVVLGRSQDQPLREWSYRLVPEFRYPMRSFVFRYRTRDDLIRTGIIAQQIDYYRDVEIVEEEPAPTVIDRSYYGALNYDDEYDEGEIRNVVREEPMRETTRLAVRRHSTYPEVIDLTMDED